MTFPAAYYEGKRAVTDDCPYGLADLRRRAWWWAGFNDRRG